MTGQQIGAELGVAFILEGSVRKAGSKVRITAQLISSKDGGHLWADRFDREFTDIFAIQDEITHAIVEQLKVKLLPQEKQSIAQAPTGNVEAYTYYLRGRQFLLRGHKSYYKLARRMFSKAVELDPLYARAYAGIADCDIFISLQTNSNVSIDSILATSGRAIELDDQLAEAHASLGFALALAQRYPEAVQEFDKAIALDPNSFETYYFYARAAFAQGEEEKAANLFKRAAEIKPDDYQTLCLLVPIYKSLGRKEESRWPHSKALNERSDNLPSNSTIRGPRILAPAHFSPWAIAQEHANGPRAPWRSIPTISSSSIMSPVSTVVWVSWSKRSIYSSVRSRGPAPSGAAGSGMTRIWIHCGIIPASTKSSSKRSDVQREAAAE